MRFTLAQLRKFNMPYEYDEQIDLKSDLVGIEDIVDSSICSVHSVIRDRGDGSFKINFKINLTLTLEDAVSLSHIEFPIDIDAEEIFSDDESIEDAFLIEGITLDTKEAILANILINKPMTTSNEDFNQEIDEEEPEEKINPAFASLKDLL